MSAFVNTLRRNPDAITVGTPGSDAITVRAQMIERWETVALRTDPSVGVRALKALALEAFGTDVALAEDWVIKLKGHEVRDESVTLAEAGARDGSTFLVHHRARRPVR
ncbi:MAG: hypothetical protein K2X99_03270 [Gemmatimonadaceae bacterium]|nr:hypothetical protein [Gemmatimonadaceae bacterium]